MNDSLIKLYESRWSDLLQNSHSSNASYPLLIKVHDEFQNADIKIMVVGQETDGWCGLLENGENSISNLMDEYFEYFHYSDDKNRRPFWNRKNFRYFQEQLTQAFPDRKVAFIWNNVSKIGNSTQGGEATHRVKELEAKFFDVFEDEFEILKPDIIIFTIGDRRIPIDHEEVERVGKNPVAEIKLLNYPQVFAVRTYHPNAKIKGGKSEFKRKVVELIKKKLQKPE